VPKRYFIYSNNAQKIFVKNHENYYSFCIMLYLLKNKSKEVDKKIDACFLDCVM